MRAVVQRVTQASVTVDGELLGNEKDIVINKEIFEVIKEYIKDT